jgi:hypothetical protein
MGTKQLSPNALVKVTSCLDVPHANLAQMALAKEGIQTWLGNANFVSWYWHYSNAVGGVTIHVRRHEAEQARKVLGIARAKSMDILPSWTCSSCGQRISGQWDACWQCGQWADGTPATSLAADMVRQPAGSIETVRWWNVPRLVAVLASIGLMILILKGGWIPFLLLVPLVLFFIFLLWQLDPLPDRQSEPHGVAEPSILSSPNFRTTGSRLSKAIVQRAWQASILAILSFPPLGFYSMRLLWKLNGRETPLSRVDRWRCWAAFIIDIPAILFCFVFVWALLRALLSVHI